MVSLTSAAEKTSGLKQAQTPKGSHAKRVSVEGAGAQNGSKQRAARHVYHLIDDPLSIMDVPLLQYSFKYKSMTAD